MSGVLIQACQLRKAPSFAAAGFSRVDFCVRGGECVGLEGPPGVATALLAVLAGVQSADGGSVRLYLCGETVDVAPGRAKTLPEVHRAAVSHLGGEPSDLGAVPALDAVAAPALRLGRHPGVAHDAARRLLTILGLPEAAWPAAVARLGPADRQRVAVARAFVADVPVLLLDRPTAGLDAATAAVVARLVGQACRRGSAVVGAFDGAVGAGRRVTVAAPGHCVPAAAKNLARDGSAIW